jgi:uncharacterized metal-binding protein YceD (DUF177 family)
MKYRREFEIAYVGLKNGIHTYTYNIGKPFFDLVEADSSEFESVEVQVVVHFNKHPDFFELKFEINGAIVVPCDRCGEVFSLPLWDEFNLIVKLKEPSGEDDEADTEDDGDIVFLSKNETVIDLSEWIYEFLLLSMPMQKIHPLDAEGNSTCNKENLALLDKLTQQAVASEGKAKEEETKNIWKGLDAFRDKNNN